MNNQKKHPDSPLTKSDDQKRVITLALPEKILHVLETFNQDMAQAIMKVTNIATQKTFPNGSSFEIVKVAPHKSVFIVGSDTLLSKIEWLKLVEIAPGRNLIAIPVGTSLESLEVAILELIESMPSDKSIERSLLVEFRKYVGKLRRYNKISRAEIMIIDTEA